jgi:adenylate cyclase
VSVSDDTRFLEAGLLDDLDDPRIRDARLALLRDLAAEGVSLEEMKEAIAQDRLAFLLVDRVLAGEMVYTSRDIAERAGVELDLLLTSRQAMGLSRVDPDERAFGEYDLEAARTLAEFAGAGLPAEGMLEITRALGRGLAQGAEAIRMMMGRLFLQAGVTERELATRNAQAASELLPRLGPLLLYILRLQIREQARNVAVSQEELAAGASPNAVEVFVGFTDMVGFTRLGERIEVDELGQLVGRLADLAQQATQAPARIIKTIGDAVMFVSPAADPLLETVLGLVDLADGAGERFPPLRVGLAFGVALSREGDWYGRPVNLASRITGVARRGSVLATKDVRDAAGDGFRWSAAGDWRLKGFKGRVALFRVRRDVP